MKSPILTRISAQVWWVIFHTKTFIFIHGLSSNICVGVFRVLCSQSMSEKQFNEICYTRQEHFRIFSLTFVFQLWFVVTFQTHFNMLPQCVTFQWVWVYFWVLNWVSKVGFLGFSVIYLKDYEYLNICICVKHRKLCYI